MLMINFFCLYDFKAMDQPKAGISYQHLKSLSCMALLLVANLVAYIHFMTHVRTSQRELNEKYAFFATYLLYIFIEGVLAPTIVVLSVRSLSEYFKQYCKSIFEQMKETLLPRRNNKVVPEITINRPEVVETKMNN